MRQKKIYILLLLLSTHCNHFFAQSDSICYKQTYKLIYSELSEMEEIETDISIRIDDTQEKKIITPGISKTDYNFSQAINWKKILWYNPLQATTEVSLERLYPYAEISRIILNLSNSKFASVYQSSTSTNDGRPIYKMEIGNGKETVLITAGVHGREIANTIFLTKFISHILTEAENGNKEIIRLLEKRKIILIPCVNPDGFDYAQGGLEAVKNKNLFAYSLSEKNARRIKSNANGIDLNRNFPSFSAEIAWYGAYSCKLRSSTPDFAYFCGYTMGSENETKVAMNFLENNIPNAIRYIDIHSAGHCIYAGKPHLSDEFNELSKELGEKVKEITRYSLYGLDREKTGYCTDGSITDYAAEIASGYTYNDSINRIAPKDSAVNIRKTNNLSYKLPILTIETLVVPRVGGLKTCSTPKMHITEWEKRRIDAMLFLLFFK